MGTLVTWDSFNGLLPDYDLINVTIEVNAVAANVVEFRLETTPHIDWWKAIRVPDGLGSSWELWTKDDKHSDSVALWAHQVRNGQVLEFKKAKLFGVHTGVYDLGGLERLEGGTRVTFRWVQDAATYLSAVVHKVTVDLPEDAGTVVAQTGQTFHAEVQVRNLTSGDDVTVPWNSDTRISLGSDNPRDNEIWGRNRVNCLDTVCYYQLAPFSFWRSAPLLPGSYRFCW